MQPCAIPAVTCGVSRFLKLMKSPESHCISTTYMHIIKHRLHVEAKSYQDANSSTLPSGTEGSESRIKLRAKSRCLRSDRSARPVSFCPNTPRQRKNQKQKARNSSRLFASRAEGSEVSQAIAFCNAAYTNDHSVLCAQMSIHLCVQIPQKCGTMRGDSSPIPESPQSSPGSNCPSTAVAVAAMARTQ